jgi:hypothetical protein
MEDSTVKLYLTTRAPSNFTKFIHLFDIAILIAQGPGMFADAMTMANYPLCRLAIAMAMEACSC